MLILITDSSLLTILFPIFASYKALRTSDPAQLTPWLMYWVSFALVTLFEAWTWYLVSWIPFYAYMRLFALAYLVLPQTQGARLLYQTHIHPFLATHEESIDRMITNAHEQAKSAGLQYIKRAIQFVKQNLLGMQPPTPQRTHTAEGGSYAQTLLGRFNLPSASYGLAAPAGDVYGLLSAAMGTIGRSSAPREVQAEELSRSGTLIPQNITSTSEKIDFLASQREKLRILLTAMDQEASGLEIEKDVERRMGVDGVGASGIGLQKSKSEVSFDTIEKTEASGQASAGKAGGGSWLPWSWGSKQSTGASTGIDTSR